MARLILTGDINLMNVTNPNAPFRHVTAEFRSASMVFSNLECCLYAPPRAHSFHNEGFYADPAIGAAALRMAGIGTVGIANNVNYGDAAILASVACLDEAGILHTERALIAPPRTLPRSSKRTVFVTVSCNAVRSIGRRIMRPARMIRGSP